MLYKTHQTTSYTVAGLIYYTNYIIYRDVQNTNIIDKCILTVNQFISKYVLNVNWLFDYQRHSYWQGKFFIFSLLICVAIGALLPDIDHPNSKLGRHMPQWFTNNIEHRTFTHSLLVYIPLILALQFIALPSIGTTCINALLLGACLHILEDYFSIESIHLFYPFGGNKRTKYSKFRYHTGGLSETIIFYIMLLGAIIVTIMWLADPKTIILVAKNYTKIL